jgi:hypothetical protein
MKYSQRGLILFSVLFGVEGILAGQTMIERGMITGASSGIAAPAAGLKKAVSGIMGSVDQAAKAAQVPSANASPSRARVADPSQPAEVEAAVEASPVPAAPAKIYEDPRGIQAGMANEELIRRFGPPTLAVTSASNGRLLTYAGKNGMIQLELRNEKVVLLGANGAQPGAVVVSLGQRLP